MIPPEVPDQEPSLGTPRAPLPEPKIGVELPLSFDAQDLKDLCEATIAAIRSGGGFGWIEPPPETKLESYWRGVLLVPERELFVARMDGVIAGAVQLMRAPRNNEAQSFAATLFGCFVTPKARGNGIAKALVDALEKRAFELGVQLINLDLRETQKAAIRLFEEMGFRRWGEHPFYAKVGGRFIRGLHYYKFIDPSMEQGLTEHQTKRMKTPKPQRPLRQGDH